MTTNDLYQQQLQYIFNRPVTEPVWYWGHREEEDCPFDDSPLQAFEFIERLCQQPKRDLAPYTDGQVAIGLEFVFNGSGSNLCHDFKSAPVDHKRRQAAVRALFNLFGEVLNERCVADTSAHQSVILSKLNNFCYMFWDVCPLSSWVNFSNQAAMTASFLDIFSDEDLYKDLPAGAMDIVRQQVANFSGKKMTAEEMVADVQAQYDHMDTDANAYYHAIASVMERCLALDNPACVESGLHGLGHMAFHLPNIAVPIIDRYLKRKNNRNVDLVQYAKSARTGMIL